MTEFLFNSSGGWIAFRRRHDDKYVFDVHGKWVGWLPWGDADVVDTTGRYLGTIIGNRFVALRRPYRGYPGYPGYPGYLGYPGYPGYAGYRRLPFGASDIKLFDKD